MKRHPIKKVSQMTKNYVGIDLGTTESTVSIIEIARKTDKPIEKLRTISIYQYNSRHEIDRDNKGLQSSIYIDRDNKRVYTGEYAKSLYSSGNRPLNTIRSVKTRIGGESMIQVPLDSDKTNLSSYDMTELSAVLLKNIKKSIDKQTSDDLIDVTITIPAAFNSDERNATLEAAHLAGFTNINLLDEPTAVLLNFLNSENSLESIGDDFFYDKKKILIYDIGGGTLDISIAEVQDYEGDFSVRILGRSKRMDFGGDDIDKYIAAYFLSEFEKINPSIDQRSPEEQAVIVSRIVSNAENAKIEFSKEISRVIDNPKRRQRTKRSVNFEIIDGLKITDITLTDDMLKEVLSPVISSDGKLLSPLKKSLKEIALSETDINIVLLTGGSGKFYLVEETLNKFFHGKSEIINFTEQAAVSKGAAIHSYNQTEEALRKVNISDIMSDSVFIKKNNGFDKLISYNATPGSSGEYSFIFERPSNRMEIFLYYGADNEDEYKYREITGVYKDLDRFYETGEKLTINWEFDINKTIKIFLNKKELLNTRDNHRNNYELVTIFNII